MPCGSAAFLPRLPAALLALLCWCPTRLSAEDSGVLKLTAENFKQTILANSHTLVKFYAPWCGHCKQLEPEYEKASAALRPRGVLLAEVDATIETSLAEDHRVEGFPTLYFFRGGQPEEYGGGRDNASIVNWVEEHTAPALTVAESAEKLATLLEERTKVTALPYFVARGSNATVKAIFTELAEAHRLLGGFLFIEEVVAGRGGVVQVHRGIDDVVEMALGSSPDASAILAFLQKEAVALFGEVNEENFELYNARASVGMLWVCFHPDTYRSDAALHNHVFKQVAQTFLQFPVVYLDTKTYQEHVKEELGCLDFPTAVLQLGNFTDPNVDPRRYKFSLETDHITVQAISAWVEDVVAGKVEEDQGTEDLEEEEEDEEDEEELPGLTAEESPEL